MNDFSILIGGKAGDGINQSAPLIGHIFNRLGYRVYIYFDYPSLIRGGHNFSIIRLSKKKISTHLDKMDFILALNQDCIDLHRERIKKTTRIIYDSDSVNSAGLAISLGSIVKEEGGEPIMRNSCIIGALCKLCGIKWEILKEVFTRDIPKEMDLNLKIADRGYKQFEEEIKLDTLQSEPLPLVTGNEAIGLGLAAGNLDAYVAYPMTPASSILHFLAAKADDLSIKVIHPESELAVILMTLGFAYAGKKVACGTSGGGFCLMTEAFSLAGLAEIPVVIVMSQRTGPSTGVPTYTAQGDLLFVLNAGHGEFVRLVIAPGDVEEAYLWSQKALRIAWKYQVQPIVLVDKTLSEGTYSFDIESVGTDTEEELPVPDIKDVYKRYLNTEDGISPMAFPPEKGVAVKVNSYTHDECGITTEDAHLVKAGQDKIMRKERCIVDELDKTETVKVYGNKSSKVALLCWGSNKGVSIEAAEHLGLKVVQPVVLKPFPVAAFKRAMQGAEKVISIETSYTAQLVEYIGSFGFSVDEKILKYDGRPFGLEELIARIEELGIAAKAG